MFKFLLGHFLAHLFKLASARVHSAMRPSTQAAYNRHFRNFLLFCTFLAIAIETLSVEQLLSYCEFLYCNQYSPSAIANALAGLKSRMQSYGLKVSVFSDIRINYFLKSLRLRQPFRAKMPHLIDFKLLRQISQACIKLPHQLLFRSVYLSNLVPHSVRTFSPLQHLARGDVFLHCQGCTCW